MLRIVFMGTPEFAVPSLEAILNSKHEVEAVVTAPDKPAGRGRKIAFSDVKIFCEKHDIPLLQPVSLKDAGFLNIIKGIKPDLMVVVAFRMLPEMLWSIPEKGTINLHASLLPQYRGAAPINHAIINGEKQTGLTTFFINNKIDTGNIIKQQVIDIDPEENMGELHDRMKIAGSQLLLETLDAIDNGNVQAITQESVAEKLIPAPKLSRETTRIDWNKTAEQINNQIRGLSPYPGAWTTMIGKDGTENSFKILSAIVVEDTELPGEVGSIETDVKSYIHVKCGTGMLKVNKLQLSGRGAMLTDEFLRGYGYLLIDNKYE